MPVLNQHVGVDTPLGATLAFEGATFRTWAPAARDVYVVTAATTTDGWSRWTPMVSERLFPLGDDTWAGFVPNMVEGDPYLFWIRGPEGGDAGFKRDPYARELGIDPPFPNCPCIIRDPETYSWRVTGWIPPRFRDFIIYQLHIGVFWAVDAAGQDRRRSYGRFLDVIERLPYLRDLGINAVQFLPIQEYSGDFGLGYSGLDYFSPEMTYQIDDDTEIARHLATINNMLTEQGLAPLTLEQLRPGPNQLKCLVDLCHLHGLAVIFDVVYNHAGGGFGFRDLYYYDQQPRGDDNRSLYFIDRGWAGGKVFAYWRAPVRHFLIDNARFFLREYRIDGLRYDEVTVIHDHGGDDFCRELTTAVRATDDNAIQIAEYWAWDRAFPVTSVPLGLGFDAGLSDRIRVSLRTVLAQAARGGDTHVNIDLIRDTLGRPPAFPDAWRAVQHLENHDVVRWDYDTLRAREPRVPTLADPSNPRSWYARSRTRVVTSLLLTAPGLPMLFMGQEVFEDKPWHDDVANWSQFLIWWDGFLHHDRDMQDFHRFVTALIWLRRNQPALRGEGLRVPQTHEFDRVIVVHRWHEDSGQDVVVVASLNEHRLADYRIELPLSGEWNVLLNSDSFDRTPEPGGIGQGASLRADGPPGRVYAQTARITVPANSTVILGRA